MIWTQIKRYLLLFILYPRFLSRPAGFEYLNGNSFIQEEFKFWKTQHNLVYTQTIESQLAETFSPSLYKQRGSDNM